MHQYQLQRYSGLASRYRCPQCQHRRKTLTLYIDTQTNQPLHPDVGKCDREVKCAYHFTPKQYFEREGLGIKEQRIRIKDKPILPKSLLLNPCSYIPHNILKASLSRYDENNLVEYLKLVFGERVTAQLLERYLIGTSKHWHGATVFWQVDAGGRVRTGKVMLFNATNGKRVKLPFNHISWVHTLLKKLPVEGGVLRVDNQQHTTHNMPPATNFNLTQCFFGEHLLHHTTKPVAIVESEKTAIIASAFMPAFTWIATGGLSNLTPQKCAVLRGCKVYLYPDLNAYDAWQAKAAELSLLADIVLFPLLEQIATAGQRADGLDIADYLMGLCDW